MLKRNNAAGGAVKKEVRSSNLPTHANNHVSNELLGHKGVEKNMRNFAPKRFRFNMQLMLNCPVEPLTFMNWAQFQNFKTVKG